MDDIHAGSEEFLRGVVSRIENGNCYISDVWRGDTFVDTGGEILYPLDVFPVGMTVRIKGLVPDSDRSGKFMAEHVYVSIEDIQKQAVDGTVVSDLSHPPSTVRRQVEKTSNQKRLEKLIAMCKLIEQEVVSECDKTETTDSRRTFLQDEVLFPLRSRLLDFQTKLIHELNDILLENIERSCR
ncbi:MAG: hypothetical protein AAB575_01085 [Patescibacteria group bacterium]